jgi:hypothetical protein
MERQAEIDLSKENKERANQEEKGVKVRVRQRASRREVKQVYEKEEAEARARFVLSQMLDWCNLCVGASLLNHTETAGRRLHHLDTTWVEVSAGECE